MNANNDTNVESKGCARQLVLWIHTIAISPDADGEVLSVDVAAGGASKV